MARARAGAGVDAGAAQHLMSIGRLAEVTGVSSRTIRYYEELGIIPEPRRTPAGTRKYPEEYRHYIDAALALKKLGFSLEEIRLLGRLAIGRPMGTAEREEAARVVEERATRLERQAAVLRKLRARLDSEVPVETSAFAEIIAAAREAVGD